MDLASPRWARASVLALHLASGLRDAMWVSSPQEFLRTPPFAGAVFGGVDCGRRSRYPHRSRRVPGG